MVVPGRKCLKSVHGETFNLDFIFIGGVQINESQIWRKSVVFTVHTFPSCVTGSYSDGNIVVILSSINKSKKQRWGI